MEEQEIAVRIVSNWNTESVAALYRAGGWWKEEWSHEELTDLMRSSYAFVIAYQIASGNAVGMGRAISDGVSDAYIQDLVVLPEWRGKGIGKRILSTLIKYCRSREVGWIGLIAEQGTKGFYASMGFSLLEGCVPMKYRGEITHADTEKL
jgi:ribosomal protein S18 acetylase RimI-like enzyme